MSFDGQIMSHQIWYLFLRSMMSFDGKVICHQIWYLCLTAMMSLITLGQTPPGYLKLDLVQKGVDRSSPWSGLLAGQKSRVWHVTLIQSSMVLSRQESSQPMDWTGPKMDQAIQDPVQDPQVQGRSPSKAPTPVQSAYLTDTHIHVTEV